MPAAADRLEFAPPSQPGALRSFTLAVLAHVLLVVALTWGLKWKRDSQDLAAEAELWASVPEQAAPKEVAAPPPPPPVPVPREQVQPTPNEAEIALERDKKAQAARRQEEEALEREAARKRQLQAQQKQQEQQRLAAENRRRDEEKKRKEREEQDRRLAQQRTENLRRIQGLAGATGSPSSSGTAAVSSGPSASWAARVRARVKPNIAFSEEVSGNPEAVIEVRLAPDGTIVGKRVVRSSGVAAWDAAVLRAIDKTEVLPRDVDGRVHSPVSLVFRPRD
jgi:colicin import membrane protein